MPKSSKSRQEFNAKKPYLLAAAYALVVGVFAYGWFYDRVEAARREGLEKVTALVEPLTQRSETLKREMEGLKRAEDENGQMTGWLEDQTFWADVFVELRRILLTAEEAQRQKLNSAPGTVGVWIDTLITTEPTQPVVAQTE